MLSWTLKQEFSLFHDCRLVSWLCRGEGD
uniref:Uncharacterized protein n=1 Tax=Nelumbo nucifera TaxID=4432 RepID=A0A822Z7X4_NELNU|nr:TPA_asm: hypothetical protein HUJ06_000734 [Nelumbo nucifera]